MSLLPMDAGSGRIFFIESRTHEGTFHITVRTAADGQWWCSCPVKSRVSSPGNVTCFHIGQAQRLMTEDDPFDPEAFARGFDHYKDEKDRQDWLASRATHPVGKDIS